MLMYHHSEVLLPLHNHLSHTLPSPNHVMFEMPLYLAIVLSPICRYMDSLGAEIMNVCSLLYLLPQIGGIEENSKRGDAQQIFVEWMNNPFVPLLLMQWYWSFYSLSAVVIDAKTEESSRGWSVWEHFTEEENCFESAMMKRACWGR